MIQIPTRLRALWIRSLMTLAGVASSALLGLPITHAASATTLPPDAPVRDIVSCAEARTSYNLHTFPGYAGRVSSIRQGWDLDGKLQENYRIQKRFRISPTGREETFERGEKNGREADMSDFWMEKLGLSKKYNAEAMNLFTPEHHGRYEYISRGPEKIDGRNSWKLSFKVKDAGSQELQKGNVWIDQSTCGVIKAEGDFPKLWVTQDVKATLSLTEVKPGLWLPARQQVNLNVSMPLMKRKAMMIDEFSAYQVTDAH